MTSDGRVSLGLPVKGLVLERGCGEQVLLGRDIVVSVVGVAEGKVKLHFSAPKSTVISRGEFGVESHMHKQSAAEHRTYAGYYKTISSAGRPK